MSSVLILSGPVGAGKTTIARALIASAPGAVAHIEGDAFWSFIAKPVRGEPEEQAFKMIMRAMTASARHYARDGYEVILDFSIPPWYLDAIRALLVGKPFDYVVVRPSESVCAARASARPEGAIADYAPYHDLYTAFEALDGFTIRDDLSDPMTVAARIRAGLEAGTFRTS